MKAAFLIAALALVGCSPKAAQAPEALPTQIATGAYMIVQGKNYKPQDLGPYAASLPPIYAKYGGRYVAFSTDYETVEGQSDYQATIISAWPSVAAAKTFWTSPEYRKAIKLRDGIGEFDVIIVPALPTSPK